MFQISHGHLLSTVLHVEGSAAARGTVRVGSSPRVTGTLGGKRFTIDLTKVRLASAGGASLERPPLDLRFPEPSLAQAR